MNPPKSDHVLVTGSSGFVGRLAVACLLTYTEEYLILPVRERHDSEVLTNKIKDEILLSGDAWQEGYSQRLRFVPLPAFGHLTAINQYLEGALVKEIIHCAACIDYYDKEQLQQVNVDFVKEVVDLAKAWQIEKLIYVSTAFSAGYTGKVIPEARLQDDAVDHPNHYTKSKFNAEALIADAGVPFLCLRPPIVIGHSEHGYYTGKAYGLYQMYKGVERILCRDPAKEFHVVGKDEPVHFIHQDTFQNAFLVARDTCQDNTYINMISSPGTAPTGQDLWESWFTNVFRPEKVTFYPSCDDIDLAAVSKQQRTFIALASDNMDIAAYPWSFQSDNYDRLIGQREGINATTKESVDTCQKVFVGQSDRIKAYINTYG